MERYIILPHKLVKLNLFGVLPPLHIPFTKQIGCNRDITDRSVEPDIEDLMPVLLGWDSDAPFEVTSDAFIA